MVTVASLFHATCCEITKIQKIFCSQIGSNINTVPADSLDSTLTCVPSKAHPRPWAITATTTAINAQTVVKVPTEGNLPLEISGGSDELALTELPPL